MNEKKESASFKKKFDIKEVNSATLCDALERQGYTIIEYNGIDDSEDVANLIEILGLQDQVSHCKCFTYQDSKYRLVFVHEDLNEEERLIALAHEEGHIWNGHMTKKNVFGEDVIQEHEANEFSHYLLKDKSGEHHRRRVAITAIVLFFAAIIGTGFYFKQKSDEAIYTEDLYRTESGTKYHIKDCIYIKDRTDVFRLTKEEFESGEYEPCEVCMPDKRE